jgi:cell division protein FtsA
MNRPVKFKQFERRGAQASRRGSIAALDVGTSKIACLIAENIDDDSANGLIRITGFGHQVSEGLNAGQVVDMRAAEDSIRAAVDAAERMAGIEVRRVIIGVSANRLESVMCASEVPLNGQTVTADHMAIGLRHACEEQGRDDYEILHAIPTSYSLDDSMGITDPRGMHGDVLKVNMHLILAPVGPIRNLLTCIEQCHLECEKLVATPYASALSTLMQDETDLGATHIDLGGGTSSVSVFSGGAPVFTSVVPVGGEHITNDIARGLNISLASAERIKTLYGSALANVDGDREQFEVPVLGGDYQTLPRSQLTNIIRPRLEETFEISQDRILASGYGKFGGSRLVLTGGGAQLSGARELAQTMLEKQPRIGVPMRITGLPEAASGPSFAACAGLLSYAGRRHPDAILSDQDGRGFFNWLAGWLRRNF